MFNNFKPLAMSFPNKLLNSLTKGIPTILFKPIKIWETPFS